MAGRYLISLEQPRDGEPLYVAISRSIISDIVRRRLRPGERLPGSRKLAEMLGVNRNTVHAALAELSAQGWVEAQPARGVFVSARSEASEPKPFARAADPRVQVPAKLGFELGQTAVSAAPHNVDDRQLILTGGVPDPRLFPRELLARAYRRVLALRGERLLDYGDARGEPSLRRALADMLTRLRGMATSEADVLVTRGSQNAIWLAAHCLLGPGDRVGVESWGYPPAWQALRSTGAELVPLEVDGDGVRIESIEGALCAGPLRALYLTPHHQYPTMVALDGWRRLRLLELAKQHRIAILEDDYTHEFQYAGRPRMPLASADRHGLVVYLGTLSKILAPGLRIGYAVAPAPLLERMAALRFAVDRQGDSIGEAAVAELLEDGEIERHARRMRLVYAARRDVLANELTRRLGSRVSFELPPGGMALWIRAEGTAPTAWVERAKARGVTFRAGRELSLSQRGEVPFVRMGFTRLNEAEIAKAVKIAASVF
jgi:GntR family transcriptional regulator / MocR family aminotransferase